MRTYDILKIATFLALLLLWLGGSGIAQDDSGIDPEALIERILTVEKQQRQALRDVTFDAEYVEREEKDGEYVEKLRLVKKVYIMFTEDTAFYKEEFLEMYKDGELKSEKDLRNEAKDRMEKKEKRKGRDVSYPMLKPFYPNMRELYDIRYEGVAEEKVAGHVCHHFRVDAREEVDTLLNGDYYFEAGEFQLVQVDFEPAKLVKKMMFRLKELNMSILYGSTADGIWLPRQFDVEGKGKAAIFFGVKFAGTEYYRNPTVNTGLDHEFFVSSDEDQGDNDSDDQ